MPTETERTTEVTGLLPDLWRKLDRLPSLVRERAVTLATCLAAIALSTASWIQDDTVRWVVRASAFSTEPWRLLTSVLVHANALHLALNLSWMWPFGQIVERRFGSLRTAALYVLLGAGSACAQYAVTDGGIGLSGLVYGLFGFLWTLSRRHSSYRDILDVGTIRGFVVWFFLCILLTLTSVLPIANAAHASGCVLGALAAMWTTARNVAWGAATLAACALCVCGATWLRPHVNARPWTAWNDSAYELFVRERYQEAADLYRRSLDRDDDQAYAWNALGCCLHRLQQWDEASAAFDRAHELVPTDAKLELDALHLSSWRAARRRDFELAATLYKRLLVLDPDCSECWDRLGSVYDAWGKPARAKEAYEHVAR